MMAGQSGRRPSEWRRLFHIAIDLIDQLRENAGGYDFEWSLGGGTAMMIQIGHRESHDVDIFLNDPQLLGFIDPSRSHLHFDLAPSGYQGDGLRFQKFAFEGVGEIDFIVAGALTRKPFETREVEGKAVRLETIPEIIAKKVYHRGPKAKPRDISTSLLQRGRNWNPWSMLFVLSLSRFPEPESGWKSSIRSLSTAPSRSL